ncbi:MAG: CDP-diacylglycerol--glycerol-3-phosphate 3-phosphatidyltransferase [Pirellulales bacterium]
MSVSTKTPARSHSTAAAVFNVPNQLTALRFVLSIVLFVIIEQRHYMVAMYVFIVAAGTDWLDGYYARKYGQVTTLGRIFDPFVDKIIICGTFIFLAAIPGSGLVAWMAVVVVGREMLVTALRGYIEQHGGDFSASMAGKLKMVFQCAAAALSLFSLTWPTSAPAPEYGLFWSLLPVSAWGRPEWLVWALAIAVWLAVLSTIYSGVGYILAAARMLRR